MKKIVLIAGMLMTGLVTAQEEISLEDYRFTTGAAKAGILELKLGELAIQNGASAEIRMLGERIVDHHNKTYKELKKLADQRGIFLVAGMNEKQQKQFRKISEKKGKDFDRACAKKLARDHKAQLERFEREARNGQDPELRNWALVTLQTLELQVQLSEATRETLSKEKLITVAN